MGGLSAFAGLGPQANKETYLDVMKAQEDAKTAAVNRRSIEAGIPLTNEQVRGAKLKNDIEAQSLEDTGTINRAFRNVFGTPQAPPVAPVPGAAPISPVAAPAASPLPAGQPQPQMLAPSGMPQGGNPGQSSAPMPSAPTVVPPVAPPVPIAPQAAGLPTPGASLQQAQPAAPQSRLGMPQFQQVLDAYRKDPKATQKGYMGLQESLLGLEQKYREKSSGELAQEESAHKLLQGPVLALSLAQNAPDQNVAYGVLWDQATKSEPDLATTLPKKLSDDPVERKSQIGMVQAHFNAGTALAAHAKELAQTREFNVNANTKEADAGRKSEQYDFGKAVSAFAANPPANAQAYQQSLDNLPHGIAKRFEQAMPTASYDPAKAAEVARGLDMSAKDQTEAVHNTQMLAQQIKRDAETQRHNISDESISKLNAAISGGRLKLEQTVNGMKYGPGTQEYWVKQLSENPDSIKEMPPELRSTVGQKFTAATGLPLPTPLNATGQNSENAARNTLDNITFIRNALKNPEIQKQIGPIMGRLGNLQQATGEAVGLSDEAARTAQELRTRMRYFVFQEGKALFAGRVPQGFMSKLEESSANVKMEPQMLQGALDGAAGSAQGILENNDRQRFGGKARSAEMRGVTQQAAPATSSDMIKVQIPGQPPGSIHSSQKDRFLKDHPGSKVLQ